MAHNEFHMLKKLIHELDDERNDIYIHIDKKTKYVDEDEILSWVEKAGLYFAPRKKIYWGTISIAEAEIVLLEEAIKREYHYYHLLSGVDFPLKSQDFIHDFFEEKDSEYLSWHRDGEFDDFYLYKVKHYFPLLKYINKGQFNGPGKKKALGRWLGKQQWRLDEYQNKIGIDRTKKYRNIIYYKGDNWFSITHKFAKYVVSRKKDILKMYFSTNCSDEFFMQTLAMNSDFKNRVINTSLRHIDWERGGPYEFTEDDYNELVESKKLFARKISYDKEPALVKALIDHLHPRDYEQQNPLISVIVPCYNVEEYVAKCVDSLISQTYPRLEILLIDDGSTDNTLSVIEKYTKQYENVRSHHRENGGLSAARNTGIEVSKGEFIAFVDSDDWVDKEYISKLYQSLVENDADIVACGYQKEEGDSGIVSFDKYDVLSSYSAMKILGDIYPKENVLMVLAWNKLYRRDIFTNIRYPAGKIHEDEYIAHRVISNASSIAVITDVLYHYRIRDNSITGANKSHNLKRLDLLDAFEDRIQSTNNMFFGDLQILMLYTYFEGMKELLISYSEDVFEQNGLYSTFRRKAFHIYCKYFTRLDGYQRKEYLKRILFLKKYRSWILKIISEKDDSIGNN